MSAAGRKYRPENLIPMFRLAAKLREEMRAAGFTDNGGAIHSAERVLNILGMALNYPELTHINNLKNLPGALFSVGGRKALEQGDRVLIEHVSPLRELTRRAIGIAVNDEASDDQLLAFLRDNYRLVLLSADETLKLNKQNRSKMTESPMARLADAGIVLAHVSLPV